MAEVLANTDMLRLMLAHGIVPRLPKAVMPDEFLRYHPDFRDLYGSDNDIVSVEYDCDEEVQCIEIDDADHLYMTDGYMPTHNTSNIIFLKSTDDSMLETLQKMSGITHRTYTDQKATTRDQEKIFRRNEGKITYTQNTKEVPVISFNDMAFISDRNSIVFRAGDSPVWNRNETILPMSWRLFQNTIKQPGVEYTLQTIPTLSSAVDFDVRQNQPNFTAMLEKRIAQANLSKACMEAYKKSYGYTDDMIVKLDPDNYSDEIMRCINEQVRQLKEQSEGVDDDMDDYMDDEEYWNSEAEKAMYETNDEQLHETERIQNEYADWDTKRYAQGLLSREDLIPKTNPSFHALDRQFLQALERVRGSMERDTDYFCVKNGSFYGVDGELFIEKRSESESLKALNKGMHDKNSRVFAEADAIEKDLSMFNTYKVHDAFYKFLVSLDSWEFADGEFDRAVAEIMMAEMNGMM